MIAQYVENGKNTWDRTPELSLAINTSVSYKLGSHGYPDPGPGTATSPQNPSERAERLKEVFLIVFCNIWLDFLTLNRTVRRYVVF